MSEVLILNQKLAHSFSYYDLETGRELHRIRFPDYPHEFAVDSENRYACIGHSGIETHMHQAEGGNEIFVVDIAEAKHVRTLSVWPFRRVHGLVMDAKDRLYALSEANSTVRNIPVPAKQPSCPVFAGLNLEQLIVTSASEGMDSAVRKADPGHGQTFLLTLSGRGLPSARCMLP